MWVAYNPSTSNDFGTIIAFSTLGTSSVLKFLKSILDYHVSIMYRFCNEIEFMDHSALWLLCFLEIVSFAFKSHCDFMIRHNQIWWESTGALQIKKNLLSSQGGDMEIIHSIANMR